MKELEMKESLADVMAIQLDFLSKFYPEIRDSEEHIMNIITLEEERFDATVKKGLSIVKRSIKRLKKEGKSEMPLEMLSRIADATGIKLNVSGEMPIDEKVQKLFMEASAEALTNAVSHADANTLIIELQN